MLIAQTFCHAPNPAKYNMIPERWTLVSRPLRIVLFKWVLAPAMASSPAPASPPPRTTRAAANVRMDGTFASEQRPTAFIYLILASSSELKLYFVLGVDGFVEDGLNDCPDMLDRFSAMPGNAMIMQYFVVLQ